MKKSLFLVLVMLAFALAVSAAPAKLVLWAYFDGEVQQKTLQATIADFNKSQSDVEVSFEYVPFVNFKQKLTIGLAANDMPDLVFIDNPDNASYAALGAFADISDLVKTWEGNGKFFPGPWKSTLYNGKQYGIPTNSNCLALYYDKKAFKDAGLKVPETWDQLRAAAKKLTSDKRFGLAISAIKSEEGTFQYLPWVLSTGADVTKVNSAAGVKSLAFLRDLVADKSMSQEIINWTQGDAEKQFATGRAAMMINGPWNLGAVKNDNPNLDYGIANVPRDKQYSSVLGGENLAITKTANRAAAWTFLKYFCSKENLNKYNRVVGTFPPRTDAIGPTDVWNTDPYLAGFAEQLKTAMPRGPHPRWPEISNAMSEALQKGVLGIMSPQAAMDEAQAKIAKVLK